MAHDFEAWWICYPKRSGENPKAEARKVWDRLLKAKQLLSQELMIERTKAYASECIKTKIYGTTFVPHARTWLHQRRFDTGGGADDLRGATACLPLQSPQTLPVGYEDVARKLIEKIGATRYTAWFGKARWSNGGDVIKIAVPSRFEVSTIEINYTEILEMITGKSVLVECGPGNPIEP